MLEKIRKPVFTNKRSKIINAALMFGLGVALGIFAKWMDNLSIDNTIFWQNFLETLDLGNVFSEFPIWLLIALMISIYSKDPISAGLRVLIFFVGMTASYHLYTIYFSGFNPLSYMMIWYTITFISPFLGYISWYAKGSHKISLLISSIILGVMFKFCFAMGFWYFDFKSMIDTIIFMVTIIVLYVDVRTTLLSLLIGIGIAFILSGIIIM